MKGLIQAAQSGQPNPRPIYIAYDEWNVWYRARGGGEHETGRTRLEEIYNFEDALAMGMFFNSFFRHADMVKMANLAQIVNVHRAHLHQQEGPVPPAHLLPDRGVRQAARQHVARPAGQVARLTRHGNRKPLGYLDVSATYDPKERAVYLNVLNRSEEMDITTRIDNVTGTIDGAVAGLGDEPPRPEGHPHLRGRPEGPPHRAPGHARARRQRLRVHLPGALVDDPEVEGGAVGRARSLWPAAVRGPVPVPPPDGKSRKRTTVPILSHSRGPAATSASEEFLGPSLAYARSMDNVERVREPAPDALTPDFLEERRKAGWRLVAVEWERSVEPGAPARVELPFGWKVSEDGRHLEEDTQEQKALLSMMDMIVADLPISAAAEELNRQGFRMRKACPGPPSRSSTFCRA